VKEIVTTRKQAMAWRLLQGPARAVLLDGGARSGKSFIIVTAILDRAMRYPGSRHLVARYRLNHAKTSIWEETMMPLIRGQPGWRVREGDLYIEYENGARIWLGGFDDKDRIEKLLGHEYVTIYANEVSEISYEAFTLAWSRLAQRIEGCQPKAFLDCNPPSPMHWAHRMFFEGLEPRGMKPLANPGAYARLQMNPIDNEKNLAPGYIHDMLDALPNMERRRFRDGEWVKPERCVFHAFQESMVVAPEDLPKADKFEELTVGIDFGLYPAACLVGWQGDHAWLLEDWSAYNITASVLSAEIETLWAKKWGRWAVAYCDPSGGERIQEIAGGDKAENAVEDGLNTVNTLMERGQFHVSQACTGFLGEVYDYHRDDMGRIVKANDHYSDSVRYNVHSHAGKGVLLYV
jgi:PBSX family phage terminase large subunit